MTGVKVTPQLPILIMGGGPAGLTLAQGLRKRGIPYRVFERDTDEDSRGQGWAVALQWIIPRLKEFLPDDLPPLETVSHLYSLGLTSEMAVFTGNGTEVVRKEEGEDFLRADRQKLREWLGTHITIEWNKQFARLTESADRVTAWFEDGTSAEGCMVVGAEGGRSHVRAELMPDLRLEDSSLNTVWGTLELPREQFDKQSETMARSVNIAQGDDVFMFVGLHRIDDDGATSHWYWLVARPKEFDDHPKAQEDLSSQELLDQALTWTKPLPEAFRQLVQLTKSENVEVMETFFKTWTPPSGGFSTRRVTLIGDAAHKVTPLGGSGVNHAIQDAIELCETLDSSADIAAALKAYDEMVTERGHAAVHRATKWPVLEESDFAN